MSNISKESITDREQSLLKGSIFDTEIVRIAKHLVFLLVISGSAISFASELTEEDVKIIISKVESASETRNIQRVADVLSESVEIVMHINLRGQERVTRQSKQEYLQMLKEGWAIFTFYESISSNIVIDIRDNKAFVTSDVEEFVRVHEREMTAQSKQETTVEVINGIPQITKITGYVDVEDE